MSDTSLTGKRILVTGATGFIGSRLAGRLATEEAARVTGIGRNLDRAAFLREKGVELVELDLRNTPALPDAVADKDVVFHAAAVFSADPEKAQAVNVTATEELVRAAGQAGMRRFVYISTAGVYDMADRSVVDESTPLALDHPSTYPRTKAQGEKRAFELGREAGIEVTAVRATQVYGPDHGLWTVDMFRNVCEGKPVFLGDGSAHFNPVYVDDMVDALVRCATSPNAPGEAFNISTEATTWRDFMDYYGRLCGKEPRGLPLWAARLLAAANWIPGVRTPIDQGFIEMATSRKSFSTDKARDLLGWKPQVAPDEGIKRTTRSRQQGDGVEATDGQGQLNLIEAARKAGVSRFVYVSYSGHIGTDDPLTKAKRTAERQLQQSGMTYTILRPSIFMEVWLSPALGFDYPNGRAKIYGIGQNRISWISLSDVAAFAVESVDHPAAENAILELGGPEALSPLEVVRMFEKVGGQPFEVQYVSEEELRAQQAAATDSMQQTFAALQLAYAGGDQIPMKETLRQYPLPLTSVREYASRALSA